MVKRLALIVSGDRNALKEKRLEWAMALRPVFAELRRDYDDVVLIHGACGKSAATGSKAESGVMKGIDALADDLGRWYGFTVLPMPAAWDEYGDRAGPIRNLNMDTVQNNLGLVGYDQLTIGCHDFLAGSKGTAGMIRLSRGRGVETRHLTSDGATRWP